MRYTTTALCALAIGLLCCGTAQAAQRQALMNGSGFGEFDQTNVSTGSLNLDRTQSYEGGQAARATFYGGANGYGRGLYRVDWHDGDDIWYGAAFYLPAGFKSRMQGQVDLMRWDNFGAYGTYDDRGGVVIHRDGGGNLMRQRFGAENADIGPGFDIPEGRWFWLEVHQRLSKVAGQAFSEVFVDGQSVSQTTQANTYGRGVDRMRFGIVAIDQARQDNALTLWFDRATISSVRTGPVGASAVEPNTTPVEAEPSTAFDRIGVGGGTLVRDEAHAYDGAASTRVDVTGAGGFARGAFDVDWQDGDEVWFGAAFRLQPGFAAGARSAELIRWDNWPHLGDVDDRSAILLGDDGRARLVRERGGGVEATLGWSFAVPEDRWVWLEVHQRLAQEDGRALSEVFLDGRLVSWSLTANTYGRGIDRVRFGIVESDAVAPITLWLDRATAGASAAGPLPWGGTH